MSERFIRLFEAFQRPKTLVEVAVYRHAIPACPLYKPFCEFLDEFYEAAHDDRAAMLAEEPAALIDVNEAAYLAASAEHLSIFYELAVPTWVDDPRYTLSEPYFIEKWGPLGRALALQESPWSFRQRNVYTEARPLRRKLGPWFADKDHRRYGAAPPYWKTP